jgi:hypothetical protein
MGVPRCCRTEEPAAEETHAHAHRPRHQTTAYGDRPGPLGEYRTQFPHPYSSEAQWGLTKVDFTHVAGERLSAREAIPVEGPRILAAGKSAPGPILVKDAK